MSDGTDGRMGSLYSWIMGGQWLKWSCEAEGGGFTRRSQVGANPIPIPRPTNLALFGYKITLYSFQLGGGLMLLRGLKSEQGLSPSAPSL